MSNEPELKARDKVALRMTREGAVNGVGAVGQLDGAHAAVLHHQKSHRLDVAARAGAAAEQVLVGGVLAVEVGVCGSKAERDAGHRQDGGARCV